MADYQGPYSGAQVDAALKAATELQPKVTAINSKLTELDSKIEKSSKTVYVWNWNGSNEGGTISKEEFNKMIAADIVVIKLTESTGEQQYVAERVYDSANNVITLFLHTGTAETIVTAIFLILSEGWQLISRKVYPIPTKVSELENDSKFVEEENLATINGKKLTEGGNIVIEGGSNVEVVDSLASDAADKALSAKQGKVLKTEMDAKAKLDETGKIVASQLPDYILGQVMFGGKTETLVNGNLSIRPSASFAAKFPAQYNLAPGSFSAYEGVYFIVGSTVEFAGLTLNVGDWLISTGEGWEKVDNTDAVSLVAGLNGNIPASALAKALAETAGAYALALKSEIVGANAYITDFTVQDLDGLASGGEQPYVDTDLPALEQALTERRIILVPYDSETSGYGVLVGVADDFLYMRVITAGAGTFEIEATRGDDKIYRDKVTKETVGGNSDSSVYITDFTIQDLEDAVNSQIDITANLTLLEAALAAHKVILVPYPADDGYLGYGLLSGYAEDLLYCTVYAGFDGLFYDIEAIRGDTTIIGQLVYKKTRSDKQDNLISGENIKTINGQSLLGKGNIDISGGSTSQTQEYAPLKYLENTGTQYIDTGLVLTQDDVITVDFEVPDSAASISTDKILLDARDDSYGVRVSTYADNKKWYARFGHNSGATSAAQSAVIRQGSLVFSKSSLVVNGSAVISSLTFTAMPTGTLKLFSGVTPAGAISAPSYARISSCKVTRGSETILNLIPVQRTADGVLGMRDLVSGNFLTNAGTGTFGYELAPVAGEATVKKYPSLTDEQKAAMQALMDDYYNNRGTFYYEFTHNRNAFTSGSQCYDSTRGKFKQCCATFVQHLMMGRSINDFLGKTASTYSSTITKTDVSEFGYYFDFKYRKYLYGLTDTDENGETTYHGYVQPNADNFEGSYSYNSYYHPDSTRAKKQNFNGFCNANDMARELYEMGCEIPFSELEIGDIIFTYDNDLADNSSMFNFVAWRHIYHVGMVYDVKQIDASSKEIYYIECTSYFDTETRPIEKPFLSSSQMDLRFKAFKLTEDMAFCARMPSVFGYEPNVPDQITSSPTP